MSKISILIMLSLCFEIGCFQDGSSKKNLDTLQGEYNFSKPTQEFSKNISYPIVFAKLSGFSLFNNNKPEVAAACFLSSLYLIERINNTANAYFLCGPTPLMLQNSDKQLGEKNNWEIPFAPEVFYWQQNLKPEHHLVLELLDTDGLPWPTSSTMIKEDIVATIRLEPIYKLRKAKGLFLVGYVLGSSNEKVETWSIPLTIVEGSNEKTLWTPAIKPTAVRPPPKKISKKNN